MLSTVNLHAQPKTCEHCKSNDGISNSNMPHHYSWGLGSSLWCRSTHTVEEPKTPRIRRKHTRTASAFSRLPSARKLRLTPTRTSLTATSRGTRRLPGGNVEFRAVRKEDCLAVPWITRPTPISLSTSILWFCLYALHTGRQQHTHDT